MIYRRRGSRLVGRRSGFDGGIEDSAFCTATFAAIRETLKKPSIESRALVFHAVFGESIKRRGQTCVIFIQYRRAVGFDLKFGTRFWVFL